MKIKPKYTIPILWIIIIFCFLTAVSCTNNEKYPNKMDTLAEKISKLKL